MAIVNNHDNSLHNLRDLNGETMDLVRSFFLRSFIYAFCYNEIVNDLEILFQVIHPCVQLLCRYRSFSCSHPISLWHNQQWVEQTAYDRSSLMYIQKASIVQLKVQKNTRVITRNLNPTWNKKVLLPFSKSFSPPSPTWTCMDVTLNVLSNQSSWLLCKCLSLGISLGAW